MTTLIALAALLLASGCAVGWWSSRRRVDVLAARIERLEREVHDDLVPTLDVTRRESEEAYLVAREASRAAGIEEAPPRLAAEPITAPVVRAVAFGAGARRALARFASDVTPLARTRRNTLRVVTAANVGRRRRRAG